MKQRRIIYHGISIFVFLVLATLSFAKLQFGFVQSGLSDAALIGGLIVLATVQISFLGFKNLTPSSQFNGSFDEADEHDTYLKNRFLRYLNSINDWLIFGIIIAILYMNNTLISVYLVALILCIYMAITQIAMLAYILKYGSDGK